MKDYRGGGIMTDRIERIGKQSVIQHGQFNKRIYLIKLYPEDAAGITTLLNTLAREEGYTKIFCKVPTWSAPLFNADGYIQEAFVPGFYQGFTGASFMSKFLNSDRLLGIENGHLSELSTLLRSYNDRQLSADSLSGEENIEQLKETDAKEISEIYRKVFPSYPFPIHDPDYIKRTMKENMVYFGVRLNEKLIALSSAEMDMGGSNAEMTDFATLPEARGMKLSVALLRVMEEAMRNMGINMLYTIARLKSIPMNKTFLSQGYQYAGTLINNTNISGGIESMNVLYKKV